MHELSVAAALIEEVERAVRPQAGGRVLSVTVRVGTLSGVDPEALRLAFPVACEGTAVEGAELVIEDVAARAFCRSCRRDIQPAFPFFVCEECGGTDVEITTGRELTLQSVDVEG